jgi:hypothetical protein
MKKRFHVGYYLSDDKKMISGKTYIADNLITALNMFVNDQTANQTITLVKYIVEMDEVPQIS